MEEYCISYNSWMIHTKSSHISTFLGRCSAVAHDWQHWDESDWCWRTRGKEVDLLRSFSFKFTNFKNVLFSRLQNTPLYQTVKVCQKSFTYVYKMEKKIPGTLLLFLIHRCSTCHLLCLYPTSSGENTEQYSCVNDVCCFVNRAFSLVLTRSLMSNLSRFSWSRHSLRLLCLRSSLLWVSALLSFELKCFHFPPTSKSDV